MNRSDVGLHLINYSIFKFEKKSSKKVGIARNKCHGRPSLMFLLLHDQRHFLFFFFFSQVGFTFSLVFCYSDGTDHAQPRSDLICQHRHSASHFFSTSFQFDGIIISYRIIINDSFINLMMVRLSSNRLALPRIGHLAVAAVTKHSVLTMKTRKKVIITGRMYDRKDSRRRRRRPDLPRIPVPFAAFSTGIQSSSTRTSSSSSSSSSSRRGLHRRDGLRRCTRRRTPVHSTVLDVAF